MKVNKTTIGETTCSLKNNCSDKPLIPADRDKFFSFFLEPWVFWLVESNFSSVRILNKENYYKGNPQYANLLYGVHCCYHDGQVAFLICRKVFNANFHLMIQDLYKLPILSKIGGFSVEKDSPVSSLKSINYSIDILSNKDNMLWLFPQGKVMPPDYKPIKFKSGLTYIADKVKGVNLIPVAVKYTFFRNHKPEIFAEIGEPIVVENGVENKKEFTKFLEDDLDALCDKQSSRISRGEVDDYEYVYKDKDPMFRRLEPYFKDIVFDKRYMNKLK